MPARNSFSRCFCSSTFACKAAAATDNGSAFPPFSRSINPLRVLELVNESTYSCSLSGIDAPLLHHCFLTLASGCEAYRCRAICSMARTCPSRVSLSHTSVYCESICGVRRLCTIKAGTDTDASTVTGNVAEEDVVVRKVTAGMGSFCAAGLHLQRLMHQPAAVVRLSGRPVMRTV